LKHVTHTSFYTQPGQYKYKDTLVYASKNFNTLSLPKMDTTAPYIITNKTSYSLDDLCTKAETLRKEHKITDKSTIVVSGDAKSPLSLALGALSSTLYGNYVVYTGS